MDFGFRDPQSAGHRRRHAHAGCVRPGGAAQPADRRIPRHQPADRVGHDRLSGCCARRGRARDRRPGGRGDLRHLRRRSRQDGVECRRRPGAVHRLLRLPQARRRGVAGCARRDLGDTQQPARRDGRAGAVALRPVGAVDPVAHGHRAQSRCARADADRRSDRGARAARRAGRGRRECRGRLVSRDDGADQARRDAGRRCRHQRHRRGTGLAEPRGTGRTAQRAAAGRIDPTQGPADGRRRVPADRGRRPPRRADPPGRRGRRVRGPRGTAHRGDLQRARRGRHRGQESQGLFHDTGGRRPQAGTQADCAHAAEWCQGRRGARRGRARDSRGRQRQAGA